MKSRTTRMLLAAGLVILVLGAVCTVYLNTVSHASPRATALLQGSGKVQIEAIDQGWLLNGPGTRDAFIFYPGGRVEPAAYMPLLMMLAEDGIDCFLVRMPQNLAVLGVNTAASIQQEYEYSRWYIGGHSLGGACAALYASGHGSDLSGLVLLAAYATKPLDEHLAVLELHGSEDTMLNRKKLEEGKSFLPSSALSEELPGGNHAQFGDYGPQRGDGTASVSSQVQTAWAADRICKMILGG